MSNKLLPYHTIICLLDSDTDDISIPVQLIIDQNVLSLGIAYLISIYD